MSLTKREVLLSLSFGQRIAEDEADALVAYFVETDQWRKIISGEADVVYGPKGSGKSALYSLLRTKRKESLSRGIILAAGENVRGTPVFGDLVDDPPASEEQFRALWKLYFLSLVGGVIEVARIRNADSQRLKAALQDAGLLINVSDWSLRRILKKAFDYVRRLELSGEIKLNSFTGSPEGLGGKVTLREPGGEEQRQGYVSADTLLEIANRALASENKSVWIVLDRLDVAFADSPHLEGNALRGLFRVYRDVQGLSNFSLKIFLRDDIWSRITDSGFREASHISRAITISWGTHSLLNLVIRRAIHNDSLRSFYGIGQEEVQGSVGKQEELFYRIFPRQVDPGARKTNTFDWMLSRTADGSKQTAPRELIHLLSAARDEQLKLLETGAAEPPGESLISPTALKAALPIVSRVRYHQTLCAEHATLKPLMDRLEGEKTQQTLKSLAKNWDVSIGEAMINAEKLAEIGFFEKRGTRDEPVYWVPFLYRDALHLVQGPAD